MAEWTMALVKRSVGVLLYPDRDEPVIWVTNCIPNNSLAKISYLTSGQK